MCMFAAIIQNTDLVFVKNFFLRFKSFTSIRPGFKLQTYVAHYPSSARTAHSPVGHLGNTNLLFMMNEIQTYCHTLHGFFAIEVKYKNIYVD